MNKQQRATIDHAYETHILPTYEKYQSSISLQKHATPWRLVTELVNEVGGLNGKDVVILGNYDIAILLAAFKTSNDLGADDDYNFKSLTLLTDVVELNPRFEDKFEVIVDNLNEPAKIDMMGKKFDIVIGNPPYNDTGDSNNQIYQHFWNLAFEIGETVALVLPYTMLTGLGKGNIDKVKVSTHIPQFVKVGIKEKWFKNVQSDICYFVCDKNQTNTTTNVVHALTNRSMDVNILTTPIDVVESEGKINFAKTHFKDSNDISITSADAGKDVVDGDDMSIYDNTRNEPRKVARPTKRFQGLVNEPFEPKVLFNIYSTGAADEVVLDLDGNCLPSAKHNLFWVPCGTASRAKELYDDITTSERAKAYFELWAGDRERIADYIRRVFKFSN